MLLGRLVIGSCTQSVAYAFTRGYYYLANNTMPPPFYEKIPIKILGSNRQDYTWSRLMLLMSLQGKLLSSESDGGIKVVDGKVSIISNGTKNEYIFEKCYIFDSTDLNLENEITLARKESYKVYDDFELSSLGSKHQYLSPKISDDELASQIHYYVSDRVDGAKYVTDCLVESTLTKEQLNSFDYSDTMARFYVQRHLESIGVFGNFVSFYKNGSAKYRKPKVTHRNRVIRKKDNNKYLDSEKIKFKSCDIQDVFR
jgi:hypothetical protein